jgi:hypothetical protein
MEIYGGPLYPKLVAKNKPYIPSQREREAEAFRLMAQSMYDRVKSGEINAGQALDMLKAQHRILQRRMTGATEQSIINDVLTQADAEIRLEDLKQQKKLRLQRDTEGRARAAETREKLVAKRRRAALLPLEEHRPTTVFGTPLNLQSDARVGEIIKDIESTTAPGEIDRLGVRLSAEAPEAAKRLRVKSMTKAGLIGGIGAAVAAPLIVGMFKGKDDVDPQVQMQLMQAMQGGQNQGVNTSRTLIDTARLLSIIKGIQEMAQLQGAPQTAGRLI